MSYDDGEVVEERDGYRVRLVPDMDGSAANPREYMATEIVTPSMRNWNVRTEGAEFQREHDELYERGLGGAFGRYLKIFHDITAVPVYMYEHSDVALSTGSFIGRAQHAEWDSGMIGWAYITKAKLDETGITEPEKAMATEVQELGRWMNGEVYGYVVEKQEFWSKEYEDPKLADEEGWDWVPEDSCWGIIGYEYAEEAAKEALKAAMSDG